MKRMTKLEAGVGGRILRAALVLVLAVGVVTLATAQQAQPTKPRRLGTCGPPPRKNPQRHTSAEGFPPLPLPVTPLRRSEPKAEPAPPLMMAKLEYGTTQDWNTDPGDVDNLMRHCRYELGLWYGWRHLSIKEVVANHKANKKTKVPILYISGHEMFGFSPDERVALRQYILDGGTLLGDACCGREEFRRSFMGEVVRMFPNRSFDNLELDHPVFRAYHKYTNVHYRTFEDGVQHDFQGPPQLLGMNMGCRTAVILTPWDMSCGWDEHVHPHGSRLLPGDAIRLGVNIISYVAGLRQLGEVQAVTRQLQAPVARSRQRFQMAQLKHSGDWNPDPNSTQQWLRHLAVDSSLAVHFDLRGVEAKPERLVNYPFVYMTGHRNPRLNASEVVSLRAHLQAGGFLFVNNCCGRSAFDQHARSLAGTLFPQQKLELISADHPLLRSFYKVAGVRDRQTGGERPLELWGVTLGKRLVMVYSPHDMITHLKQVSDPYGNGYDAESCRRLAINVVAYALQN